jgi:hypothetical protein
MFRAIVLSISILMLSGCGIFSFFTNDDVETAVVVHPELPRPVQNQNIDWVIIEKEEKVFVGTPYQKFLNHLESQEDIIRYIRQINRSVCFYRKELEEVFCKQIKDKEDEDI